MQLLQKNPMATGSDMGVAHPVKKRSLAAATWKSHIRTRRKRRKAESKKAESMSGHMYSLLRALQLSVMMAHSVVCGVCPGVLGFQLFSHELVWMFVSTRMLTEFSVKAVYPI